MVVGICERAPGTSRRPSTAGSRRLNHQRRPAAGVLLIAILLSFSAAF
jgi:hypothetical protein